MKNHNEMYQSLLSRWDEYQKQKQKRLLARKMRIKKICSGLALAAATICGCITMCFGGYAVWNYVVKPIVVEEEQPEQPVTSQTAAVTQMTEQADTAVTAVTTVSAAQTAAETAKKTTTKGTALTKAYEEEMGTEVTAKVTAAVTMISAANEKTHHITFVRTTAKKSKTTANERPHRTTIVQTTAKISKTTANERPHHTTFVQTAAKTSKTTTETVIVEAVTTKKKFKPDRNDPTETEQAYNIIQIEYIEANDIDAICYYHGYGNDPEDEISVEYITPKGREDVKSFIDALDMDIDKASIEINEMEYKEKCFFIAEHKLRMFISRNKLNCYIRPLTAHYEGTDPVYSNSDYDKGINITYDLQHEEDKKAIEEYIAEHGYDTVLPIVYTLTEPIEETTIDYNAEELGRE